MVSIYEVPPDELITKAAEELKKNNSIKAPDWAGYAKTGMHKERPPANDDWWHIRCASILRSVYKLGPIGVSKLRIKYGGKKNRGVKPERFYRGSGSIIRKAMQQLEAAKLVKKVEKEEYKGRVISPEGKSFLDKIAVSIIKTRPKVEKKPEVKIEKKETKKEAAAKGVKPEPKKEVKKETPEKTQPKKEEKKEVKPEVKKDEKKVETKETKKEEKKEPEKPETK